MVDRFETIIDDLSGGTPVLTVNRRLSRALLSRHEEVMTRSGRTLWKTPVVMPLLSWVKGLWLESWPDKPLLSDTRSATLWKKIVSGDRLRAGGLLFPRGAARAAYKAYVLTRRFNVRLPADETYLAEEARAFKAWLGRYESELKRLGFIDYPCLMERVRGIIEGGRAGLPERVVLAGFDEITPDVRALLAALRRAGCAVAFWPYEPGSFMPSVGEKSPSEIREYADDIAEVRSCARWARVQAESGKKVGIIVPELDRYRGLIINEFSAELDPPSTLPWGPRSEVFNVSLGLSLDREPLVRSALGIISTGLGDVPLDTMSDLLSSPYLMADESEYMAFSSFLRALRERKYGEINPWALKRAMDRKNIPRLQRLSERLGLWIKALEDNSGVKQLPGFWAEYFDRLLKGLAWPSPGLTLNSREFQALKAWHDLLGEFAGLDDVSGRLTLAGAAAELRAMAGEAIHQPESAEECPVQVLGLLESSGLSFDCIWVLGAHEDALPGQCLANPFIPIYLQKKAGLPRSTPEKTLEYARHVLDRVLKSAPEAVVSFPRVVEGKELRVSPLLAGQGSHVKDPALPPGHRLQDSVHASSATEPLVDDKGAPLGNDELAGLRGGTGIIKEQSACPFRAFAIYRLGARGISAPEQGLDAMERGSLAHEALHIFWQDTRDSQRLAGAEQEGRLGALIREAVAKALAGFHRRGLSKKLLELEAERLHDLLEEWMEVELQREAFTVVETEKEHEIHVGGLTIHVRLDRVDELEGGKRIIIDYKTGSCEKDYWLPGRPREPQMLLYALEGDFNAIAFASLKRTRKLGFVGVGQDDGMLPGMKGIESDDKWRGKIEGVENWADLNERWKETLTTLAGEFKGGEARVDPNKDGGDNDWPCTYCELTMLCRRFELGILNEEEEEG